MKSVLMIISPEEFKDEEYYDPKKILENNNIKVTTASLVKTAISVNGKKQAVDILLKDVTSDYDVFLLVGGPGSIIFLNNNLVHNLARKFYSEDKLVTAICFSPTTLAKTGLLKNKNATVYPSEFSFEILRTEGVIYQNKSVVVDGKIITADGPSSAEEFGKVILKQLKASAEI